MELPVNFTPFLPLINYYRDILKLDCLLSRSEQFRFYIGYLGKGEIGKRPKDFWQDDEPGFHYLYYCCKSCRHGKSWNKLIDLNEEQPMMDMIAKGSVADITKYLQDLYPYQQLKEIETDNKIITITNYHDNQIISLSYKNFKLYCNFYHNCVKEFKSSVGNNIKITLYFSENTARCIEDLINNKNVKAFQNATNLMEYIEITDYLAVSLK